jgi:hypothetical protein
MKLAALAVFALLAQLHPAHAGCLTDEQRADIKTLTERRIEQMQDTIQYYEKREGGEVPASLIDSLTRLQAIEADPDQVCEMPERRPAQGESDPAFGFVLALRTFLGKPMPDDLGENMKFFVSPGEGGRLFLACQMLQQMVLAPLDAKLLDARFGDLVVASLVRYGPMMEALDVPQMVVNEIIEGCRRTGRPEPDEAECAKILEGHRNTIENLSDPFAFFYPSRTQYPWIYAADNAALELYARRGMLAHVGADAGVAPAWALEEPIPTPEEVAEYLKALQMARLEPYAGWKVEGERLVPADESSAADTVATTAAYRQLLAALAGGER